MATQVAVKNLVAKAFFPQVAGLQLALGLFFEVTGWALLPVWYHIVFLVLIVPAVVWGGELRAGRVGER